MSRTTPERVQPDASRGVLVRPRKKARGVGWIENRPPGRIAGVHPRDLWAYRDLALFLALRDLQVRYKQTIFGVAWAVIQPLAGVAIFTFVFGRLVNVPSDGLPYPLFVYVGMIVWIYLSTAVNEAAQSLTEKSALVTKIYFPRILAPFAAALPGLVDLGISMVILGGFMAFYGIVPGVSALLFPAFVFALALVATGAGVWLAALNVQYRDVRYALPFLVQVWLFLSPVVYPTSLVDGAARYVFALNPLVGVIDGARWALLGAPPPGAAALVSLATGTALLVTGIVYFQRVERRFADVV